MNLAHRCEAGLLLVLALTACGSSHPDPCSTGGSSDFCPDPDGSTVDGGLANTTDSGDPQFGDVSVEAAPVCEGLKCQQVACNNGTTTTVSGTVFDPAGKNPLYNIVVFVPNAPLDPISHGPVCDSCGGAPISGKPVVTALTDEKGHFKLENVPVGTNIPLVMQVGKWRRKITIPNVPQCVETVISDVSQTRLPKTKSEGDMPLIALVAGCDPIHALVAKIGVAPAEFTSGSGNGAVHVYAGYSNQNGGVAGASDAYKFWGTLSEMMKYDIIINECECSPHPRDTMGPAYDNMGKYLDSGGRVFASHYHLNFYGASPENGGKAAAELQSAADWSLWSGSSPGSAPYLIDTTFPKGKAMDEWLFNLQVLSGWGPTIKKTPKGQIQISNVGDIKAAKPGLSQRWIYPQSGSSVVYLSMNLPTNVAADKRCGRAVATDLHVGSGSLTTMSEQEAGLEFRFFDLAWFVIDDGKRPVPPTPN